MFFIGLIFRMVCSSSRKLFVKKCSCSGNVFCGMGILKKEHNLSVCFASVHPRTQREIPARCSVDFQNTLCGFVQVVLTPVRCRMFGPPKKNHRSLKGAGRFAPEMFALTRGGKGFKFIYKFWDCLMSRPKNKASFKTIYTCLKSKTVRSSSQGHSPLIWRLQGEYFYLWRLTPHFKSNNLGQCLWGNFPLIEMEQNISPGFCTLRFNSVRAGTFSVGNFNAFQLQRGEGKISSVTHFLLLNSNG